MKNCTLLVIFFTLLLYTSCSEDNDIEAEVVVPNTYTFLRDGNSTVNLTSQNILIQMAEVLIDSLKNNNTSKEKLTAMFAHEKDQTDFTSASLNSSEEQLKANTASSQEYFTNDVGKAENEVLLQKFQNWIDTQVDEVFENWDLEASEGQAGKMIEVNGGDTRRLSAKGLEIDQIFSKSLIGALMVDQILNHYLSVNVLDEGANIADNDNGSLVEGENYTAMEHNWDNAYGFLYGTESNQAQPDENESDSFLNKYVKEVGKDSIAIDIYNAFKVGRAAIVARDYDLRSEQVEIIRNGISEIIGIKAIEHLRLGKQNLVNDKATAFHNLSQAFGFIQSLRFTQNPSGSPFLTSVKIEEFLTNLTKDNGFWNVTDETLDEIINAIETAYGF